MSLYIVCLLFLMWTYFFFFPIISILMVFPAYIYSFKSSTLPKYFYFIHLSICICCSRLLVSSLSSAILLCYTDFVHTGQHCIHEAHATSFWYYLSCCWFVFFDFRFSSFTLKTSMLLLPILNWFNISVRVTLFWLMTSFSIGFLLIMLFESHICRIFFKHFELNVTSC